MLNSIVLGSLYALMALGLTITFSVTRIANFAHAELITVGGYTTAVAVNFLGFSAFEALALSFVVSALLGLAMDELAFKPLYRRGTSTLFLLVASIGVGLVVRYVLFSFADLTGNITIQTKASAEQLFRVGRATVTTFHLTVIPTTLTVVVILHALFHYTLLGKALRAIADNEDLARASGIKIFTLRRLAWLITGGVSGLAGGLWAVNLLIDPNLGWDLLLRVFAASILGGLVSFWGTIIGGYIIGLAENLGITLMNTWFGINIAYRPLISFMIIIIVFLLKPTGFAGINLRNFLAKLRVGKSRS